MEAHADAVIDAFHMSFACASQILENLTLIDGDDLFRWMRIGAAYRISKKSFDAWLDEKL